MNNQKNIREQMNLDFEFNIANYFSAEHYHVYQYMKVNPMYRLIADINEGLKIYKRNRLKQILDDLAVIGAVTCNKSYWNVITNTLEWTFLEYLEQQKLEKEEFNDILERFSNKLPEVNAMLVKRIVDKYDCKDLSDDELNEIYLDLVLRTKG